MRPIHHTHTVHRQGDLIRTGSQDLMMPVVRPMREPGTNYLTYITAHGPQTYQQG